MTNESSILDKLWKFLLTAILLIYACTEARQILVPIVFSVFMTIILNPVVSFLERKKINSVVAILITLLLLIALLTLFVSITSSQMKALINDMPNLLERYTNFIESLEKQLTEIFGAGTEEPMKIIKENSTGIISSGSSILTETLNATSSFLSFITIVPIYTVFMLLSRKNLVRFFTQLQERSDRDYMKIVHEIKSMVYNYIGGLLIVIAIISSLNSIGLFIIGIEHAIFLGILSGVLTILPYIGNLIGGSIPLIVALITKESLAYPIAVLALFAAVQFIEGNFITPKIIGNKVNINPLVAIIALIVGASIWGIIGMIIAIPTLGIMKIIFSHIDELKPYATLISADKD